MNYGKLYQTKKTPQSEAIPGTAQVSNSAGGFAWAVDDWARLDRFLILGTEGGTYYVGERALTVSNAEAVRRCIAADGMRTVERIIEISASGRAPKNDPALFALAMAASMGNAPTKRAALKALPAVARIGTHLFHFLCYVEGFRGWGRGLRRAVGEWYGAKSVADLAYQAIKYQQRDGWSHRDALRLSHPIPDSHERTILYRWITRGWEEEGLDVPPGLDLVRAFEQAKRAGSVLEICSLIAEHGLPREAIPTEWLKEPDVWRAMLDAGMPLTAMIRNLGNMTRLGVLKPLDPRTTQLAQRITDKDAIRKARIHPLGVLLALATYSQGAGFRGRETWDPVAPIVDALDQAFYVSFGNITPTGKRIVLALDVSGSMAGSRLAGTPLSAREGSAAMVLVTAAVEPCHAIVAFSGQMVPVIISPRERLDDVVRKTAKIPFGRTDCALPMLWALGEAVEADAFVVYTDSETWFGNIHPSQALGQYRRQMGIQMAKLVVVGMCANEFSIADPNDPGMLDVVGFDAATPNFISDFIESGNVEDG